MNSTPIPAQTSHQPTSSNVNPAEVVNPLCIILVKNGSKGDRLLFRYPYSKKFTRGGAAGKIPKGKGTPINTTNNSEEVVSKNESFTSSTGTEGTGMRSGGNTSMTPEVFSDNNEDVPKADPPSPIVVPEDQDEPTGTASDTNDDSPVDNGTKDVIDGDLKTPAVENQSNTTIASVTSPGTVVSPAFKSPTSLLAPNTKNLFETPLAQLSSKAFMSTPSVGGIPSLTPDFGIPRIRKVSRTTAPIVSRGEGENPYSISKNPGDDLFTEQGFVTATSDGRKFSLDGTEMLSQLSDKDLSNLLAVNSDLAERKFELKLNFVRFVGHPTLMHNHRDVRPINPEFQTSVKIFHIIFCLNAAASHSIVKCFFDLSKRLGIGLRHEEYRCGFMNQEMRRIIATHDEACTAPAEHLEDKEDSDNVPEKVFDDILSKSKLAQLMKRVYDDVCNTGYTFARINNWVQISFCLPHRVHVLPFRRHAALVEPETIHRCLEAIRPYHAILLLVNPESLIDRFWLDCSSTIPRLLQVYSPLKSLQTLAADADLTLSQVVEIASHLVYWAHATVIYPLCESNVYFLAPDTPIDSIELETAFRRHFPQLSLVQVFADFSLAIPLGERMNPMIGGSYIQSQLVDLVTWMLQRRLLVQLHTYIYLATFLDSGGGIDQQLLDNISVNVDPDISLNLNVRSFDFPEEDDATVSDTYSETNVEDASLTITVPAQQQGQKQDSQSRKDKIELIEERENEDDESKEKQEDTNNSKEDRAKQNNNNDDVVEPLDKFRSSLPELNNEAIKRAVGLVNKAALSVQDIKMFSKLAKYFTGEFHVEEIMYRENVRRSQLMLLLDKFRECLITVEKEDADISFFRNVS